MAISNNAPTLQIMQATVRDTPDLIYLFGELHRYNAELDPRFELADDWEQLVSEYVEQAENSEESAWLLARIGDGLVGFVLVEVHCDAPFYRYRRWAEIVSLYVEPEFRGSGVAETLMQHAYDWARQHNLRVMQLYVTASNERAQRFYAKQGFVISQHIMRRTISDDIQAHELAVLHYASRLHFSEGGARPLDMHERMHHQERANDQHED